MRAAELVRAGSSRVWAALTTKEGLEAWFATRVLLDVRPGGFIHFRWKDWGSERYTGDARADVEEAVPRRRLVFHWQSHPQHPRTKVEVVLEPRGPITVVRLEESGFGAAVGPAMANAVGWGGALVLLKHFVEHGIRHGPAAARPRRLGP